MRTFGRSAFTLIELLVTIGIVAALFAIVLPVILNARQRAYDGHHVSYLRQVAVAQSLYADEAGVTVYWTPPLVRAGYLDEALLASPLDPSEAGVANRDRGGGPGTSLRPTPYKDSLFGLYEYAGGSSLRAILDSPGAGWAIVQADPPDSNLERFASWRVSGAYSRRYFRLLLDGAVVTRCVKLVSVEGGPRDTLAYTLYFTDDESLGLPEPHE